MSNTVAERTAQIAAHRACCGVEHDPRNGKLHGYCVVCGVPWPCEYAGKPTSAAQSENSELLCAVQQVIEQLEAWAETHDNLARHENDAQRAAVQMHKRNNYLFLVHLLRKASIKDAT